MRLRSFLQTSGPRVDTFKVQDSTGTAARIQSASGLFASEVKEHKTVVVRRVRHWVWKPNVATEAKNSSAERNGSVNGGHSIRLFLKGVTPGCETCNLQFTVLSAGPGCSE